ncbi:hypothetical protein C3747_200g54 [Trypanosoma cruzi]|uniref:Uncharacterized protein n=1 Tax=Trypanosoma cruzi TaxID=5693 RepID=A0A2V2W143_TRYCR|nr:hypothetical protein C3747_200g54 [Trypanosoma cruzi]
MLFLTTRKIWCWVAYKEWIWIALTVHRRWICWRHSGRPWPHVSTIRPPERTFFMWPLGWNQMDSGNGFTARSGRRGRTTGMSPFPPLIFNRDENKGTAYGYLTFHGENTTRPVQIDFAEVLGGTRCSVWRLCSPTPKYWCRRPVDGRCSCLRAHPFSDAADNSSPLLLLLA